MAAHQRDVARLIEAGIAPAIGPLPWQDKGHPACLDNAAEVSPIQAELASPACAYAEQRGAVGSAVLTSCKPHSPEMPAAGAASACVQAS